MGEYKDNIIKLNQGGMWKRDVLRNLLRITTANAIMWCNIFHLFVKQSNKKETHDGRKFPVQHKY